MDPTAIVQLVVADGAARDDMAAILNAAGIAIELHAFGEEAPPSLQPDSPGCFIVELQSPDPNGRRICQRLRQLGCLQPFIAISNRGNIEAAVEALQLGAIDYLEKPIQSQRLIDAVQGAIRRDNEDRARWKERRLFRKHLATLTPRERDVFDLMLRGHSIKETAHELGISSKTVETHRHHIKDKLKVDSLAQLLQVLVPELLDGC